ncbi:MAG: hypothetical protein AB7O26_19450, partial [Planctomycetaceae bacterium]
ALTRLGAAYWTVVGLGALFTLARFSEAFLVLRAESLGVPAADVERTSRFGRVLANYFPDENQVSFVDVKVLRGLMNSRKDQLVNSAVAAKSLSAEDSTKRLNRLIDVANLVDSAFLAGHVAPDHIRLVFGGVTDPPTDGSTQTSS